MNVYRALLRTYRALICIYFTVSSDQGGATTNKRMCVYVCMCVRASVCVCVCVCVCVLVYVCA